VAPLARCEVPEREGGAACAAVSAQAIMAPDVFVGNDSRGGHLGAAGGDHYGKHRVRIGWGLLKNSRRAADKADGGMV
jgi:hypothetical protein